MALTKATYAMISGAVLNVFDYMTEAQRQDVITRAKTLDVAAPIQAALDAATSSGQAGKGYGVYLPAGTYRIGSTLSIPNATMFFGAGRNQTVIEPTDSFTGVMITDKGNASKVVLRDLRVNGRAIAGVTDLIKMGYGDEPLGGGEWWNLFLYGGNVGSPLSTIKGINAVTNVMSFCEIEAGFSGSDFYLGPNSGVTTFDRCFSISAVNYGFYLNGSANLVNCEIEAPALTCVGVYVSRETVIEGLTYSAAYSNPYAIEIDANCPQFTMTGFANEQAGVTVLGEVIKDNRSGYPTYWGTPSATYKNVALLGDTLFQTGKVYSQNLQEQTFLFSFRNSGGTLQHSIQAQYGNGNPSSFVNKISGASETYSNTPTGTDSTTAFVAGAKVYSANTSCIILNTPDQTNVSRWKYNTTIALNSSGTVLTCSVSFSSINVNGVTRHYVLLQFLNASTGAAFDLTALGSGDYISVAVDAFIQ